MAQVSKEVTVLKKGNKMKERILGAMGSFACLAIAFGSVSLHLLAIESASASETSSERVLFDCRILAEEEGVVKGTLQVSENISGGAFGSVKIKIADDKSEEVFEGKNTYIGNIRFDYTWAMGELKVWIGTGEGEFDALGYVSLSGTMSNVECATRM